MSIFNTDEQKMEEAVFEPIKQYIKDNLHLTLRRSGPCSFEMQLWIEEELICCNNIDLTHMHGAPQR